MSKNFLNVIAFLLPVFILSNSCKKEKKPSVPVTVLTVTRVAAGLNAIDLQMDYKGDLYILTSQGIRVFSNGSLTTPALPGAALLDFIDYDGTVLGPPRYIAADQSGRILLARDQGIRIVYKDGKVDTFNEGDTGWGVRNLKDLEVSRNNDVFYASASANENIFKLDDAGIYGFAGIHPFNDYTNPGYSVYALDIDASNRLWMGTSKGIARAEISGEQLTVKEFLGSGTLAEGPVAQVKIVKASQLEISDDASVLFFIDEGNLKQLKNSIVKTIRPMADTPIALSKDGKKLYFIENNDLNVISF